MAKQKRAAQDTLYTCLEGGLKLMHPFMPFVTEELYQRLNRRANDKVESIVKASYPVEKEEYSFVEAQKQFDDVFEVIKTVRSLAAESNIKKDGIVSIQTQDDELLKLLKEQHLGVKTLCKGIKELTLLEKDQEKPKPEEFKSALGLKDKVTVYLKA